MYDSPRTSASTLRAIDVEPYDVVTLIGEGHGKR